MYELFWIILSGFVGGGILETAYRSYWSGKLIKPKLINIQMYVFTSVFLYYLYILELNLLYVIISILIFTTGIEYLTGTIYFKHTGNMPWDYSKERFNYRGIICLKFSIYWLAVSLGYIYIIIPAILRFA